jgi:hypothetical protein
VHSGASCTSDSYNVCSMRSSAVLMRAAHSCTSYTENDDNNKNRNVANTAAVSIMTVLESSKLAITVASVTCSTAVRIHKRDLIVFTYKAPLLCIRTARAVKSGQMTLYTLVDKKRMHSSTYSNVILSELASLPHSVQAQC